MCKVFKVVILNVCLRGYGGVLKYLFWKKFMIRTYRGFGLVIMGLFWDSFWDFFGHARAHSGVIMGAFGTIWE